MGGGVAVEHNIFLDVKILVMACVTAFTVAFGWLGWLVVGWVFIMLMDWGKGSWEECKNAEWASAVAREGSAHKGGMVAVVALAGLCDMMIGSVLAAAPTLPLPIDYSVMLLPIVLLWYIFTEAGSIVENVQAMGSTVPASLV